jgi:hypothetical protein
MISCHIYTTPKEDYVSCTISNDKVLISASNCLNYVSVIYEDDKKNRRMEVSTERINKFIQKVARKILCTAQ